MSSVLYNYKHGFSGFAAMLSESQAKDIAGTQTISCLAYVNFSNYRCNIPYHFKSPKSYDLDSYNRAAWCNER